MFPANPADPMAQIMSLARNTQDILYGRWETGIASTLFVWRQKQRLLERVAQTPALASISPDGRSIAYYATGPEQSFSIIICDLADHPNIRRIAVSGQTETPTWSLDGGRVRFPVFDPKSETAVFWEVRRDGSAAARYLASGGKRQQ